MENKSCRMISEQKFQQYRRAVEVCRMLDKWHVLDLNAPGGSFPYLAEEVVPKACAVVRYFDGMDSLEREAANAKQNAR